MHDELTGGSKNQSPGSSGAPFTTNRFSQKSIDNRNDYIVSSIDEIHKKCNDGYWIIINDKEVVLYKKEMSKGNFYNSVYVNEIFKLKSYECPRIVSKLLKKPSMFDNFTDELKASVSNYRTRSMSAI